MTTSGRCGPEDVAEVVLGVDTHLDFHVAVVLDRLGRRLGESKAPTTLKGYRKLLSCRPGRMGASLYGYAHKHSDKGNRKD
jgi:hypothetical protein